jgi:hypothetical protein
MQHSIPPCTACRPPPRLLRGARQGARGAGLRTRLCLKIPKRPSTQCLMSQFPTHPNREFFEALQGIKSGDQGNFFPHQGIRSRPLFGICFDDKCDRPRQTSSLPRRQRGRRQMLEAAEADLAPEAGFCPCERRQAFPEIWSPSSSTRTNGVSGFAMAASVLSRAARRTSSTQAAGPNPLWTYS